MPNLFMTFENLSLNRDFTAKDIPRLIDACLLAQKNILPYVYTDNMECLWFISRNIGIIEKHGIYPDKYWHGDAEEFESFISLLSSDFPCKEELLRMAKEKTNGVFHGIADHYYQRVILMFDQVKRHHGYDILRPTEYMLLLYPDAFGKWYIYTNDVWNHAASKTMTQPLFTVPEGNEGLFRKKLDLLVKGIKPEY